MIVKSIPVCELKRIEIATRVLRTETGTYAAVCSAAIGEHEIVFRAEGFADEPSAINGAYELVKQALSEISRGVNTPLSVAPDESEET